MIMPNSNLNVLEALKFSADEKLGTDIVYRDSGIALSCIRDENFCLILVNQQFDF